MLNYANSSKTFSRFLLSFFLIICTASSLLAGSKSDYFIDSDDYKSKDFKKGILVDYKDLQKGDNIEWAWVEKGVSLSDYTISINSFKDSTDDLLKAQLNNFKEIFKEYMDKLNGKKGTLNADINVYEVQKFSPGKAWIPFAGGHQMQAGIGVEMIVTDKSGKAVAKFRHFAREGQAVDDAAKEAAEDLKKYISKN